MAQGLATADVALNVGVDGGTTGLLVITMTARPSATSSSQQLPATVIGTYTGAEGYHFISPIGLVSSNTGSYFGLYSQVRMD